MGKARRRKQNKTQIFKTLTSAEFQAHIQKTLRNVLSCLVEPLMTKLTHALQQGATEKWVGVTINPAEIRIGYESNGNCYTMIIFDGVGYCYNFFNGNACTPVQCVSSLPSRIIVE